MSKLKMEAFGKGSFKIDLPSRSDATFELFQAIYDATEVDISLEDDGYIVVYTDSEADAEKVKDIAEDFLNSRVMASSDIEVYCTALSIDDESSDETSYYDGEVIVNGKKFTRKGSDRGDSLVTDAMAYIEELLGGISEEYSDEIYYKILGCEDFKITKDGISKAGYGDVKGLEPADKDIKRIEDLRDKADGDEAKMHKLAQNMANTFKTSTSYEKCIRRAKAADLLELGGVAKIFYKKAEEINPDNQAAASYDDWEQLGKFNMQTTVEVGDDEVTIDVIKDELHVIGVDTKNFNFEVSIEGDSFDRSMIAANKFIDALNPEILKNKKDIEDLLLAMLGRSTRTKWPGMVKASDDKKVGKVVYRKEGMGPHASYFVKIGSDVFQLKDQNSGKELKGKTIKFHINENDEAIDLEIVTSEAGKVKELTTELIEKYLKETKDMDMSEAERLAVRYEKEHKLSGLADELFANYQESMDSFHSEAGVTDKSHEELVTYLKSHGFYFDNNSDGHEVYSKEVGDHKGYSYFIAFDLDQDFVSAGIEDNHGETVSSAIYKTVEEAIQNHESHKENIVSQAIAADFLENKYSNEEEEFTIDEFEKDAGPIPELKKFKNAFYSIVHYNKENDQFEIMIYPKELDYKKNNPKVVVLDSDLTTTASSVEEDSQSQNLEWGFYGSLKSSPFGLSDKDAMTGFIKTVELISNRTGYMENVIRDFLDSQAGRYLGDMVTFESFETSNLDSIMVAVKETMSKGALDKLRFEKFIESHEPSTAEASTSSNYDIFIDELENAKARDPKVAEKFRLHWHKLDKLADFFAEVYNGGLNQFLDHYGDNIPRSILVDIGGKACNEIVDIVRDGSNAIQDYLDHMESSDTTDEDYNDVIGPMNELTDKIYENDKIEQACEEILKFYGVKQ